MNENIEKASKAIMSILKVLSDEEWHQWSELLDKTKVSSATLKKYLPRLKEFKLIQKRVELESGKYPYPAYYRAEPELVTYTEALVSTEELSQQIEPVLLETKNPLFVLNMIESMNKTCLLIALGQLKKDKNVPESKLRFLLELWVWEPYRVLTWKLIESSKKHIDELPFEFDSERLLEKLNEIEKRIDEIDKEG